jgi:phospholipase/carboxylesterase
VKGFWGEDAGLKYVQVEPEDAATDLPLVFCIHGRGADATDLASLAPEIGAEYRWILPQGPRPVPLGPGYTGWAWYELGPDRAGTVASSRDILASFVAEALGRFAVPYNRALVMGFSQGAVMSLHIGLASETPYAGIAAMSGYLPGQELLEPILPERRDRSVLLVHGTLDETLSVDLGRSARDLLQGAGLAPEYHEFEMGHQMIPDSLSVVREYVRRRLDK